MAAPSAIDDEGFLLFLAASEESQLDGELVVIDPLSMVEKTNSDDYEQADKERKNDK